jgi:hypothetical protein
MKIQSTVVSVRVNGSITIDATTVSSTGDSDGAAECKRLWAAVLLLAIEDYHKQQTHIRTIKRTNTPSQAGIVKARAGSSAARWILWSRSEAVGSFIWVCEMLGLDPDVCRTKILALVATNKKYTKANKIKTEDLIAA